MHGARVQLTALLLGCAALAIQLDGCAGTARYGPLEDPLKHDAAAQEHFRIERLMPGTMVALELRDSSVATGKFVSLVPVAPAEYAARYGARRDADGLMGLPALGADVTLTTKSGKRRSGTLDGFGFAKVLLRPYGSNEAKPVPFENFVTLADSTGRIISADTLARLLMTGALPLTTALQLRVDDALTDVPLERIETVRFRQSNGRVIVGALIAVTFVAVVVVAFTHQKKPPPRKLDCGSSSGYYTRQAALLREASQPLPEPRPPAVAVR